jgi:hypothetical protein
MRSSLRTSICPPPPSLRSSLRSPPSPAELWTHRVCGSRPRIAPSQPQLLRFFGRLLMAQLGPVANDVVDGGICFFTLRGVDSLLQAIPDQPFPWIWAVGTLLGANGLWSISLGFSLHSHFQVWYFLVDGGSTGLTKTAAPVKRSCARSASASSAWSSPIARGLNVAGFERPGRGTQCRLVGCWP